MTGSSITNTVGAQQTPLSTPTPQHSSSPGTLRRAGCCQRGSRAESLAEVGQQHLQDTAVLFSQGRSPNPKSHTRHGSHHSGTGSGLIPQMEEDVNNNNRSSSTKLGRQVEPQFTVQNLVMVWVGGQMWEAQNDFSLEVWCIQWNCHRYSVSHSAQDWKYLHELKHLPKTSLCIAVLHVLGTHWTA